MLPKRFAINQEETLEKVCNLLKNLKVKDDSYKQELIYEMDCIIHKYAKTEKDIKQLER